MSIHIPEETFKQWEIDFSVWVRSASYGNMRSSYFAAKTSSYNQILNLESRLRDSEILSGIYESEFEELREHIRELENTIEMVKND